GAAGCVRAGGRRRCTRVVAADRLHARGHPGTLHDVRRGARPRPGRTARLRGVGAEDRRGRVALGRRTRPPSQSPPRSAFRGTRGGVRRARPGLLPGYPVVTIRVAVTDPSLPVWPVTVTVEPALRSATDAGVVTAVFAFVC